MKKLPILLLLMCMATGLKANTHDYLGPWTCSLEFDVEGSGAILIFGKFDLEGSGTVDCLNALGDRDGFDVSIKIGGKDMSATIGFGSLEASGQSLNIAVAHKPSDMLGTYFLDSGIISLTRGVGSFTGVHIDNRDISATVALKLAKGMGFRAGFNKMVISKK